MTHTQVMVQVQAGAHAARGAAPHHADSGDALFLSRVLYMHPDTCMSGKDGALISHLEYLYCQCDSVLETSIK